MAEEERCGGSAIQAHHPGRPLLTYSIFNILSLSSWSLLRRSSIIYILFHLLEDSSSMKGNEHDIQSTWRTGTGQHSGVGGGGGRGPQKEQAALDGLNIQPEQSKLYIITKGRGCQDGIYHFLSFLS